MNIPRGSNIFEATCAKCGKIVAPGKGLVSGKTGKDWRVIHDACIVKVKSPLPPGLEYDL